MKKTIDELGVLCEASSDKFDKEVARIANMSSQNAHVEALSAGAKLVGLTKVGKIVGYLGKIRDLEGYMPFELMKYRSELFSLVMKKAKSKLSKDDYDRFVDAY